MGGKDLLERPLLSATVAAANTIYPGQRIVRLGLPAEEPGWVRCVDVIGDAVFLRRWQADVGGALGTEHEMVPPITSATYVLSWYAAIPAFMGAVSFRLDRRVPRLAPEALGFHRHQREHRPDGIALLDGRFWCLPDDPAAEDPVATVVADEQVLAAVLRGQLRAHADAFLVGYDPGVRLPRRALLGVFFDALDGAIWAAGKRIGCEGAGVRDAAIVLPGGTPEFGDGSALYRLVDARGREHVSRRRVACCYYYRLSGAEGACFTCPRTTDEERVIRAAEWPDEHG
ncbi:MAG: (2Fe-2S)-binding protein [Pseudonocardia sp.]